MPGTVPIISRGDQLGNERAQIRHAAGGFESLRHEKPEAKTRRKLGLAAGGLMPARPRSAHAGTEGKQSLGANTNKSAWAPPTHVQREAAYLTPERKRSFRACGPAPWHFFYFF